MDKKWLENLNVGDKVVVCENGISNIMRVSQVTRKTQTLICVTGSSTRYRIADGYALGSDWYRSSLLPYTDEAAQQIESKRILRLMIHDLQGVNWHTLPVDTLTKIHNIIWQPSEQEKKS